MPNVRVVGVREETPAEAAQREWFTQQALASPSNLEEAARLVIGLVTGLIGVVFTVLAIAKDPLPAYLANPLTRVLGAVTILLLLAGLLAGLLVVIPWRWTVNPSQPASETIVFSSILKQKSLALTMACVFFACGVLVLALVLVIALLSF